MQRKATLLFDQKELYSEILEIGNYQIGIFNSKNSDASLGNEDALFLTSKDGHILFGVADGAGGHPKGEAAAHLACSQPIDFFERLGAKKIEPLNMIEEINTKIRDLKVGAKTTLAFGIIINDEIRCHSVGDSEIIYWNSLGDEIYSSIPHSMVGHSIRAGHIEQADSLDSPNRNYVNHLLGDEFIRIESMSKLEMKRGHTVLIGTDGLFDNLSHEKLSNISTAGQFKESFSQLSDLCTNPSADEWKKDDDIAFVLIKKVN